MATAELVAEADLDGLQTEWDALLARDPLAAATGTHAVAVLGWRIDLGEMPLEPFVVAVRDGAGRLIGAAPLALWTVQRHGLPWRILGNAAGTWASAWDILCGPDDQAEVSEAVLALVAEHRWRWDQFRVRRVRDEARIAAVARQAPAPLATWRCPATAGSHRLLVDPAWTTINQRLSKTYRRYARRCRDDLYAGTGAVLVTDGRPTTDVVRDLARIHLARWGTGKSEIEDPGRVERFAAWFSEVVARGQGGWLELRSGDGDLMASFTYLAFGTAVSLHRTAYNPAFRDHSPGVVMEWEALDLLIRRGMRDIDFGFGNDPYKRHWSTEVRATCTVSACAPTARTWLMRGMQAALGRTGLPFAQPDSWNYRTPGRTVGA